MILIGKEIEMVEERLMHPDGTSSRIE